MEPKNTKYYMETTQEGSYFEDIETFPSKEFSINNAAGSFVIENNKTEDDMTYASDDTLSFVVLESAVESFIDIEKKSISIDSSSLTSPLNSSDLLETMKELIQENTKLKETLKQNNIAMKQQFSILANWNENMLKVHKAQQEKVAKVRELMSRLKEQNSELIARCIVAGASIMPSNNEVEKLSNSTETVETPLPNFEEQLRIQENQSSLVQTNQSMQAASTNQSVIETLKKQAETSESYVSNQSENDDELFTDFIAGLFMLCNEMFTKCLKKDEEIKSLTTLANELADKLKDVSGSEAQLLKLSTKVKQCEEEIMCYKTHIQIYEEDFKKQYVDYLLIQDVNNSLQEKLIKHEYYETHEKDE